MIDYSETKSQPITRLMVWQAYKEVKANAGSGGIDNMNWKYLEQNQYAEIYKLWNRLSSGSYFPQAVKQVAIPKKGGDFRNLGIPTLLDRIAQQVVRKHSYKSKCTGLTKSFPSICVSQKSKTNILEKFKQFNLHKRRIPLEALAKEINPILTGIINYYHKFWKDHIRSVWNQLNARLLKWVKWEKDLYKMASVKYLKTKYKERPNLFAHCLLVHP